MERPSKKDIKAAVDKLKNPSKSDQGTPGESGSPAPAAKKSNIRIRKKGV